jgi:hypothetical protein
MALGFNVDQIGRISHLTQLNPTPVPELGTLDACRTRLDRSLLIVAANVKNSPSGTPASGPLYSRRSEWVAECPRHMHEICLPDYAHTPESTSLPAHKSADLCLRILSK